MKYAVEMGPCAKTYIPDFIKIRSAIKKLMVGGCTDSAWRLHKLTVIFSK
jgi:hypothetical protein